MIAVRYAVIGTGWVVDSYIAGAAMTGQWELAAVYSRKYETGFAFGEKYGVSTVYTDLNQLAASDIPAVYIASPNVLHYEQAKVLLQAGKHVLCEKPVTVTPSQCAALQQLAMQQGVIFLEAIMLMHLPQRHIVQKAIQGLGRITSAHFAFTQLSPHYDEYLRGGLPNIFNPHMATGSFMDIGVYCVYPAVAWFGMPDSVQAAASFLPSGADESCGVLLKYRDKLVTLNCSNTGNSPCASEIVGERGCLTFSSISRLTGIRQMDSQGHMQELVGEIEKNVLMRSEAEDFYRYITDPQAAEEYRSCAEHSLQVCVLMQKIRRQAGILFPESRMAQ